VSRLTFKINPDVEFLEPKPLFQFFSLRERLFGGRARKEQTIRIPGVIPSASRTERNTVVRRAPEISPSAALHSRHSPAVLQFRAIPKTPAAVATTPISAGPASFEASYQVEYKGRLISATRSEDGVWTATHTSIAKESSFASALPLQTHSFLARGLAVASAEMEIDELELVSCAGDAADHGALR